MRALFTFEDEYSRERGRRNIVTPPKVIQNTLILDSFNNTYSIYFFGKSEFIFMFKR